MIRVLLIALLAAPAAAAQQNGKLAPTVEVSVDPIDPVTVGTPVDVAITVLVPSFMPQPPVWPDLQIADAITRLPDRATVPITRRIGQQSWSGLTRTYQITPQRAADFDLGGAEIAVTYADPDSNEPREVTALLPDVSISAILPKGAEDLDPFIAAQSLTLTAKIDGLPEKPKPGDAFTLTLSTTATGTRSMLLPPLADRLAVPAGLRAYPRQPALADTPGDRGNPATATRTETIAFVIETPGSYALPAQSLRWWNTDTKSVEAATTEPIGIDVAGTPGKAAVQGVRSADPLLLAGAALLLAALIGALGVLWHRQRGRRAARPSERRLYLHLRTVVRRDPVAAIRPGLYRWLSVLATADPGPRIEALLRRLERTAFGPEPTKADTTTRVDLLAAIHDRRRAVHQSRQSAQAVLPALNPDWENPRSVAVPPFGPDRVHTVRSISSPMHR